MKFLLPLLRNNLLQLSHANQLRYADTKNRTKTITLYMLIAMILMGLLAYLIYSLKIIYSIAWSLEEVVTELVVPMVLICVILNIAISIFWGSGLLLSDTNIDSVLALPIPLRTLILSKLTVLFMVEVALTVALLLPMMVLFGLTAGMGFPFYLIVCAWNNNSLSCHSRPFGNNVRNTDLPHLEKFLCSYCPTKGSGGYPDFVCVYDLHVLQIPRYSCRKFWGCYFYLDFYTLCRPVYSPIA